MTNNNGALPESHTALRDARRRQRNRDLEMSTRPLPPLTHVTQPFRHMPLIAAIGLLVIFFFVLFGLVPGVGAAERRSAVVIADVRGDAGFYVVKLDSGQVLVITPPRRAPQLQPGAALMDSGALWQGDWRYPISRRAVRR